MCDPVYELSYRVLNTATPARTDVRFGSKGDICAAQAPVRFTPNSDRESAFPAKVMSALRKAALKKLLHRSRGGLQYAPYRSVQSKSWIKVRNPKAPAATRATDGTF